MPGGRPVTIPSMTPPTLSRPLRASSISAIMRSAASKSAQRTGVRSTFASICFGVTASAVTRPIWAAWAKNWMLLASRTWRAIAPETTSGAVIRPYSCPPPRRSVLPPYFMTAVKSPCPGLGTRAFSAYDFDCTSWLPMIATIGSPVAVPARRPSANSTRSSSFRWDVRRLCPGRRRSSCTCTNRGSIGVPARSPSIVQPTKGPWLVPKIVVRYREPKVFIRPPHGGRRAPACHPGMTDRKPGSTTGPRGRAARPPLSVDKPRLTIGLRREDGQDREEIRRVADVDGLTHEVAAPHPNPIRRRVDPRAERAQQVHDPRIPIGRIRAHSFDRHIHAGDRRGDERKRLRGKVTRDINIRWRVRLSALDPNGVLCEIHFDPEGAHRASRHGDVRL